MWVFNLRVWDPKAAISSTACLFACLPSCMHAYIPACLHACIPACLPLLLCMCVYLWVCRGQRPKLGLSLIHLWFRDRPSQWTQSSSIQLIWLVSKVKEAPVSPFPALRFQMWGTKSGYSIWVLGTELMSSCHGKHLTSRASLKPRNCCLYLARNSQSLLSYTVIPHLWEDFFLKPHSVDFITGSFSTYSLKSLGYIWGLAWSRLGVFNLTSGFAPEASSCYAWFSHL